MEQTTRTEEVARRERKAKRLADKLFFKLDRQGSRYSLRRTAAVSGTVRRENLSLDEYERELEMWKLRTAVKVIRFECSSLRFLSNR